MDTFFKRTREPSSSMGAAMNDQDLITKRHRPGSAFSNTVRKVPDYHSELSNPQNLCGSKILCFSNSIFNCNQTERLSYIFFKLDIFEKQMIVNVCVCVWLSGAVNWPWKRQKCPLCYFRVIYILLAFPNLVRKEPDHMIVFLVHNIEAWKCKK